MRNIAQQPSIHKHVLTGTVVAVLIAVFGLVIYPKIVLQQGLPAVPNNIVAEGGVTSITVTWEEPRDIGDSPITNYIIRYGVTDSGKYNDVSVGQVIEYTIEGLETDMTYDIAMASENGNGTGDFTDFYRVATISDAANTPDAPSGIVLTPGDQNINVVWGAARDNGSAVTSYKIYYGETSKNDFAILDFPVDGTTELSYSITGLTNDIEYSIYITALNDSGEGTASDISNATPVASGGGGGEDPVEISGSPIVTTTTNSATITWTTSKNASSIIHYGPIEDLKGITPEVNTTPRVTDHSVIVSGLPTCTKFWFKAASYDASNNYIESIGGEFATKGCKGDSMIVASDVAKITNSVGATVSAKISGRGIEAIAPAALKNGSDLAIEALKLEKENVESAISAPTGKTWAGDNAYSLKALEDESTEYEGTFDHAVSVSIDYDGNDLGELNPSSLTIYHYEDGSGWMPLTGCVNDYNSATRSGTVTCNTTSFSVFGLFGTESVSSGDSFSRQTTSTQAQSVVTQTTPVQSEVVSPATGQAITKDLYFEQVDPEVKILQKLLNKLGFSVASSGPGSPGHETNFFGPLTRSAVIRFQEYYKAEILSPLGLTRGTGFFGEKSRTKINSL